MSNSLRAWEVTMLAHLITREFWTSFPLMAGNRLHSLLRLLCCFVSVLETRSSAFQSPQSP